MAPVDVTAFAPKVDTIDIASGLLVGHEGPAAVIFVSDFKWNDPVAVEAAVTGLKSQHGKTELQNLGA